MNPESIAKQAKERARIALEQAKLQKDEDAERKRQEEEQRNRDDYPDILRAKVVSGLVVDQSGDYAEDLAEFQKSMRELVATVPNELMLVADYNKFRCVLQDTVQMLGLKPDIPAHLQSRDEVNEDELKPYIDRVLRDNLKARTFARLLADVELRNRVYETCAPATIEARLNTLAGSIDRSEVKLYDIPSYEQNCRERWERLLNGIADVNATGYVQSGGTCIADGRNIEDGSGWKGDYGYSKTTTLDLPALLFRETWNERDEENDKWISKPVIERLKPKLDILRKWAAELEKLPEAKLKQLLEWRHHDKISVFGWLIHNMEYFGVWATSQCVCGRDCVRYLNDVVDPFLQILDQYTENSPIVAATLLQRMAWRNGSTYGYNCPEEACRDNSKEPEFVIEMLKHEKVKRVFKDKRDPKWISTQFDRLWKAMERFAGWRGDYLYRLYWNVSHDGENRAVELWLEHRNDEAYWNPKQEDETQSAS